MAEAFHCPPSVAAREDLALASNIMAMRYFAQKYDMLKSDQKSLSEDEFTYIEKMYQLAGIDAKTGKPS